MKKSYLLLGMLLLAFKVFPVMDSLPVGDYYSMMKCRVLKSSYPGEITGYDDIELKIPFTVVNFQ